MVLLVLALGRATEIGARIDRVLESPLGRTLMSTAALQLQSSEPLTRYTGEGYYETDRQSAGS